MDFVSTAVTLAGLAVVGGAAGYVTEKTGVGMAWGSMAIGAGTAVMFYYVGLPLLQSRGIAKS